MDNNTNWDKFISLIPEHTAEVAFKQWFKPLQLQGIDENTKTIFIKPENQFSLNILQNRYISLIDTCIKKSFGSDYKFELTMEEIPSKDTIYNLGRPYDQDFVKRFPDECYFNPRFTFENFVFGNNNQLAYNASLAVAVSPASIIKDKSKSYNPLFIYGGSGLGKTHLMHAIGNHIYTDYPQLKCLYVSSEMFTNELLKAIKDRKTAEFREKYRKIDVLLIDDIQFLEGKETTQEEFFHTFNALYQSSKQIVISSDRPPNKLLNIEERLRSRFQMNMTVDIQPADYENRVAILMKILEIDNIPLTPDVEEIIKLIASKIKSNVRELEGAFLRVLSFSNIMQKPLDLPFAKEILKDLISNTDVIISADLIKKTVSKTFNVKISDLESSKRTKNIALPRQVAMYVCREMTDLSFPQIGTYFGNKDHSTVIHACDKITKAIKEDSELKGKVDEIIKTINDYRK